MNSPSRYSVVIPIYRNHESLPELLAQMVSLHHQLGQSLQVVFVVDGSPDDSHSFLQSKLPSLPFQWELLALSRNFGSFAAIRAGIEAARGPYFAVMAADLQDPPDVVLAFFKALSEDTCDVVVGVRETRSDPLETRLLANTFWWLYRRLVQPDLPPGGVDLFGCNQRFRDHLIAMNELNTSLVGLVYWLGFRRSSVSYHRQQRPYGRSAWSFRRKLRYLSDSVFAFTDLPIRLLLTLGACGVGVSVVLGLLVLVARLVGAITVPGYATTTVMVMFFGGLNLTGLGIIGSYTWRAFENTKGRPGFVVASRQQSLHVRAIDNELLRTPERHL